MGIEIEVCINPEFQGEIKEKLLEIIEKIKSGVENRYGSSYSNWKFLSEDCVCPKNVEWDIYSKTNQADIKIETLEDDQDSTFGTEFSSPILSSSIQIRNYIDLFDIFYDPDPNISRVMTMKKCGIHIHWSNPQFNLQDKDIYEKLFYKFHYMWVFYILERVLYQQLSDRGKYGVDGIYHIDKQLRGVSPIEYFEDNKGIKKVNKIDFYYWNSLNKDLSFNIFQQFPRNIDELKQIKLYQVTIDNIIQVDDFRKYLEVMNILDNFSGKIKKNDEKFNKIIKQIKNEDLEKGIEYFEKKILDLDYSELLEFGYIPTLKVNKFIKEYPKYNLSKDEIILVYKLLYTFMVNKKEKDHQSFKDIIEKNSINGMLESRNINLDDFVNDFELYFSRNIILINIEKFQKYILDKYRIYILNKNNKINLNDYNVYEKYSKLNYLIYNYGIPYELEEKTIEEIQFYGWNGDIYNDLEKPFSGKKFITFYADKDMHIEYRLFANTELENKNKFKSRLLNLFEVCDKISYRVGSAVKSLLDGIDDSSIDYLDENFFNDIPDVEILFDPNFTKDYELFNKLVIQ